MVLAQRHFADVYTGSIFSCACQMIFIVKMTKPDAMTLSNLKIVPKTTSLPLGITFKLFEVESWDCAQIEALFMRITKLLKH